MQGTGIAGAVLHLLVHDIVESSGVLEKGIHLSSDMRSSLNALRSFLETRMYFHPLVRKKAEEGAMIVDQLCRFFLEHPHEKIIALQERTDSDQIVAVKDYVAGMTDNFALEQTKLI